MDYRNGENKSKWILKDKLKKNHFCKVHLKSMYSAKNNLKDRYYEGQVLD